MATKVLHRCNKCDFRVSHVLLVLAVVDSNRSSCYFGIAYRKWLNHYLNVFTQSPSGAISMHINLNSFYVYTNRSCSNKTVRICRLVVCVCDIYYNLMSWLVSISACFNFSDEACYNQIIFWLVRTCDGPLVDNHRNSLIRNLFGHSFIQFH